MKKQRGRIEKFLISMIYLLSHTSVRYRREMKKSSGGLKIWGEAKQTAHNH